MLASRGRTALAERLAAAQRRVGELEAELSRRSLRDPVAPMALTLPAFRAQFEVDIQQALRASRPLSVALVDLDGFSRLNLRAGYAAGDRVLAAAAEMLAAETGGTVCRVAADSFAVRLVNASAEDAEKLLGRALVALEALQTAEVRGISASVGVAELAPGRSPEALLAAAGAALERAQQAGGGRVVIFTAQGDGAAAAAAAAADVAIALAQALEERDRYTGEHSESVVDLTARVAAALTLPAEEVENVRLAALLHDIGKIGIPDEILHKPGPLDEREWGIMRQHPVIGERILRSMPGLGAIARIVRHEHERVDGGGYPDGLVGDQIPVGARIILACDAYHAMVSDRPYREAMSHTDAMAELNANAGEQFDAEVVQALIGYLYGRRQSGLTTI
ncbi:MAG: bifunctional diguanylate cyclase/phosphohydrolase [Solirubrobacterales bacterium]